MENYKKAYENGKRLLENIAKESGYKYYSIVEDNYEYPHGLTLIAYEDETSMKGTAKTINELDHISINLDGMEKLVWN